MKLPTASKLPRALHCPASTLLPQIATESDAADRGKAIHAYLARLTKMTPAEALGPVPAEYRDVCESIDPAGWPRELVAERAFAWDCRTDRARIIGDDLGRSYGVVGSTEYVGAADLSGVDGEWVEIIDAKTGRTAVDAPARNAQLRFLALAAARVHDRRRARVRIATVREDGRIWWDVAELDAFDLDDTAGQLRELAERLEDAQARLADNMAPDVAVGDWCRYCPAIAACPAHGALLARVIASPQDVEQDARLNLTPQNARQVVALWKQLKSLTGLVGEALYGMARETPIPLGDGLVLGEVETERRELDAEKVHAALVELHGREVADAAMEREATQKSVERALKAIAKRGELAKLKRAAMERFEAAQAVTVKISRTVKEHRAAAERAALPDGQASVDSVQ